MALCFHGLIAATFRNAHTHFEQGCPLTHIDAEGRVLSTFCTVSEAQDHLLGIRTPQFRFQIVRHLKGEVPDVAGFRFRSFVPGDLGASGLRFPEAGDLANLALSVVATASGHANGASGSNKQGKRGGDESPAPGCKTPQQTGFFPLSAATTRIQPAAAEALLEFPSETLAATEAQEFYIKTVTEEAFLINKGLSKQNLSRRSAASILSYAPPKVGATRQHAQLSRFMDGAGLSKFTNTLMAECFTEEVIVEALRSAQDTKWLLDNLLEMNFSHDEFDNLRAHASRIPGDSLREQPTDSKQTGAPSSGIHYAKENETLNQIASKFCLNVDDLVLYNRFHHGDALKQQSRLKENTEIWLYCAPPPPPPPRPVSRKREASVHEDDVCDVCGETTGGASNSPVLICDSCDGEAHLHCAGLSKVPRGRWQCDDCIHSSDVEKIIRRVGNMYEVKWEGFSMESNTMEPVKNFKHNSVAQAFERASAKQARLSMQSSARSNGSSHGSSVSSEPTKARSAYPIFLGDIALDTKPIPSTKAGTGSRYTGGKSSSFSLMLSLHHDPTFPSWQF